MMLQIVINDLPPMPRNRSHMLITKGRRPMNIKTPLCRSFEEDLTSRLAKFEKAIKDFVAEFDPQKHYLLASYVIFTPRELLFNQKGSISSKATDLDAHKTFQDTIFKFMGVDDKLVRNVTYYSPVSHNDKWNYVVTYKLENLCNLENMSTLISNTTVPVKEDLTSFALL